MAHVRDGEPAARIARSVSKYQSRSPSTPPGKRLGQRLESHPDAPPRTYVLEEVPPDTASGVLAVFTTTDPERDTPAVLRECLDHLDSRFVGLTGNQEQLDEVHAALNANPAEKTPHDGGG